MSNKELLVMLMFTINEKAKQATALMERHKRTSRAHYFHGNYMAHNEDYSLLKNQLDLIIKQENDE